MRKTKWLFGLAVILAGLVSCNEDVITTGSIDEGLLKTAVYSPEIVIPEPCGYEEFTLWAGQDIDAGQVIVYNDAENLYITVVTTEGFQNIAENIKLWLDTDYGNLPTNPQGIPNPGQFPDKYKVTVPDGTLTYTYEIPLSDVNGYDVTTCGEQGIYIVIHVDVLAPDGSGGTSAETAWGGDIPMGEENRWWFKLIYNPQCCEDDPGPDPEYFLETAFAYGNYVFVTPLNGKRAWSNNPDHLAYLELTRNRWGWAINLTAAGENILPIYAGAGLNNTANGTLVGQATVDWDENTLTVSYDMDEPYVMEEAHVYASDLVPATIAPGQYGNIYYFDPYSASETYSYDVSDSNGDGIWIIMHAVVALPTE
jgi:hypothetical protein